MKKDTVVLGLGNPLISDEGIGTCLVEQLAKQSENYPSVEFIDAGTGGLSVLHLISDRKKAIIIDCAKMHTKPGTIKKFTLEDVKTEKKLLYHSLHEGDVLKILDLAKKLNTFPERLIIFGIEPDIIKPCCKLSTTLRKNIDNYTAMISKELTL